MRENLMFFGIKEHDQEDCDALVKALCEQKLEMSEAKDMLLDRVHRIGRKGKTRVQSSQSFITSLTAKRLDKKPMTALRS